MNHNISARGGMKASLLRVRIGTGKVRTGLLIFPGHFRALPEQRHCNEVREKYLHVHAGGVAEGLSRGSYKQRNGKGLHFKVKSVMLYRCPGIDELNHKEEELGICCSCAG